MKTKNIEIRKDRFGSAVHVLTIREDWRKEDFEEAQRMFDDCQVYTERLMIPIWRLKFYSFSQIQKMNFI